MASNDLSARMRYLQDSAQLLSNASPATSAYLMSQVNQLMFDNELERSESHRRYACGACGCIMIPGRTSSLEKDVVRVNPRRRSAKSKSTSLQSGIGVGHGEKMTKDSSMVYKCNLCGKNTRHLLPSNSIPALRRGHKPLAQSNTTAEKLAANSANTSSKKRARARKQGGLQALLAAKKESAPSTSGFGLDLMDLMKKAS